MTDSADPIESIDSTAAESGSDMKLFWACFIALVATSFVFGVRANIIGAWQTEFGLSETEKGNILGVGMWPFAISIILFSLVIDRIGYKTAAIFAVICHVASLLMTIFATGYSMLYWSTFLVAIANGTVEAFINPVVATAFPKQKTKWLNILHAGWPAGLALGALATIVLGGMSWELKYATCFIPVLIYAVLVLPRIFPPNERVAAGVSYREMLAQVGGIGFFAIAGLLCIGVFKLVDVSLPAAEFAPSPWIAVGIGAIFGVLAWIYTGSLGHWMFLLILATMGPLATTELGTDSWMPDLLQAELSPTGATLVFLYVSAIMTILRFYAGPIVHRFSPIGLLVVSAAVAIIGLLFLSKAAAFVVVIAATVYAFGKTFLWSTTLGLVAEQFPKGGALTLNGVSAVGVLGLGILGSPWMGYQQDTGIDAALSAKVPGVYQQVVGPERESPPFGKTPTLVEEKIAGLSADEAASLKEVRNDAKKGTFARVALLPAFMLLCYLLLFFVFKARGGYRPVEIWKEPSAGH